MFPRSSIVLFCGMLMLAIGVGGTITGKLPGRFGQGASRTENPTQYWPTLVGYFVVGIGFAVYYLYLVGTL